jgi:hypothetical protein
MSSLKFHKPLYIPRQKRHAAASIIKVLLPLCIVLIQFLASSFSHAASPEISVPGVRYEDNWIVVNVSLSPGDEVLQELRNGVTKEFVFHVDLFRVWKMWPDEFIVNRNFVRKLRCDPVKTEFIASSREGNTVVQKRFKSFETMAGWGLRIDDVRLANLRDLEQGVYFVRVTAELAKRKLPPVIGYFMIFLPEKEFKVSKDSPFFSVRPY